MGIINNYCRSSTVLVVMVVVETVAVSETVH